nr:hypothetical protein [Ichthyobacterium seriolicida]
MSICPLRTFPCAADKALLGSLVVKLSAISDIFNLVSISILRTFPCAADNTSVASVLFKLFIILLLSILAHIIPDNILP